MSVLKLKLLGQMECWLPSGAPLNLPTRKSEVLLAFIALAPNARHPRDRLVNLLWSDRGEDQARNSLRQCLSAIRKSLGEAADSILEIERSTISLNSASIQVDALEFEQLASASDFDSLSRAATLYQGEFLEGITIRDTACQEWLDGERGRFKRQLIEVLTKLSQQLIDSKKFDRAIEMAERLVDQDPLVEAAWRLLMNAYHEKGNRNHALKVYQRCRGILDRELGVKPEAETTKLRDRIASGKITSPHPTPSTTSAPPDDNGTVDHSIAVLPFDNLSGDPEQEYFSDGITESIVLSLSSFSELTIKSRHASFAFKNSDKNLKEIGEELEVQYIVEGSVRSSSGKIRITVQLVEAASSNQIWGKRYDADLDQLFELEEELSQTIAGTISGRIGNQVKLSKYRKPAKNLKSYDYLMRGWYHAEKLNPADTIIAIGEIQKCIAVDPQNADAHTLLAVEYQVEFLENWAVKRSRSIELARQHIERALELEPENALAHAFMSEHLLFTRDFERGMFHAEKAIELNPTLPDGYSMKAYLLASMRQYEEATKYAERSLELDPHHPYSGWNAGEVFRSAGDYQRAIKTFRSIPHTPPSLIGQISACLAGLGNIDAARAEMKLYLEIAHRQMPNCPTSIEQWRQLWYENIQCKFEEDFQTFFDLLLKAGLCDQIAETPSDIPSIAVLPFENMSGDPEQDYFSDGITNDIVTILSHMRSLRVVARYSTLTYKDHKPTIAKIAEEQGVRYILDGSVRKSGDRIRVNAQLIDSQTGENCWAENYDRDLSDFFAVQDDITKSITVEMQVHLIAGEQARDLSVGTSNLKAWEYGFMAANLQDSYITDNVIEARRLAKQALKLDPEYSWAWVVLGWTHWQEAYCGRSESIDNSMREARSAADKALTVDPENSEALALIGCIHSMLDEPALAIQACEKAISISPGNAEVQALMAFTLNFASQFDKALPYHEASIRLSPIAPNWFFLVGGQTYLHTGELDKALKIYRKAVEVEPESPLSRFFLMDALMESGSVNEAQSCADEIRRLDNSFRISGLVRAYSHDTHERERFQSNLAKMGFKE